MGGAGFVKAAAVPYKRSLNKLFSRLSYTIRVAKIVGWNDGEYDRHGFWLFAPKQNYQGKNAHLLATRRDPMLDREGCDPTKGNARRWRISLA
jgi:hypothetical protein